MPYISEITPSLSQTSSKELYCVKEYEDKTFMPNLFTSAAYLYLYEVTETKYNEIPASFLTSLVDFKEGRVVDMDQALNDLPPED